MSGHPSKYRAKVAAQGREAPAMRDLAELRKDQGVTYAPAADTAVPKLGRRRSRRGRTTVEAR